MTESNGEPLHIGSQDLMDALDFFAPIAMLMVNSSTLRMVELWDLRMLVNEDVPDDHVVVCLDMTMLH